MEEKVFICKKCGEEYDEYDFENFMPEYLCMNCEELLDDAKEYFSGFITIICK